jgi:hypothetical protein
MALRTEVNASRRPAEKNSVRYKVPPTGASGLSMAMLAAKERKPSKMFMLMMGVFPVAIKTIMVSPTALPKPRVMAAKMPGLAAGRAMRHAVCQGLAPKAREADS